MTEKNNPENKFINKINTFEYYEKFSFWVSVLPLRCRGRPDALLHTTNRHEMAVYYTTSRHVITDPPPTPAGYCGRPDTLLHVAEKAECNSSSCNPQNRGVIV